ncbi:MAG TPA: HAD family phosphatase [Chitinophagaceae bacterium]|jgi:haloacid dehalogenase superfamily, subfamily IA, variant 3 with third motif having DD or ED
MNKINTIIFDLGGVLIDWNPAYVFDTFFDDEEKKKFFFENICTPDWNEQQDAGRKIQEATNDLVALHPGWEEAIRAYYGRWTEMLGGPITETVDIFRQLKNNSTHKFYALTNWSGELFPIALDRYDFLKWFDGIVVSGDEKTRKPFPEIYTTLLSRFNINPQKALFIDDSLRNIKGAEALGINCIHFQSAKTLPHQLNEWGIAV